MEVGDVLDLGQGHEGLPVEGLGLLHVAEHGQGPHDPGDGRLDAEIEHGPVLDFVLTGRQLGHAVAVRGPLPRTSPAGARPPASIAWPSSRAERVLRPLSRLHACAGFMSGFGAAHLAADEGLVESFLSAFGCPGIGHGCSLPDATKIEKAQFIYCPGRRRGGSPRAPPKVHMQSSPGSGKAPDPLSSAWRALRDPRRVRMPVRPWPICWRSGPPMPSCAWPCSSATTPTASPSWARPTGTSSMPCPSTGCGSSSIPCLSWRRSSSPAPRAGAAPARPCSRCWSRRIPRS